jgi:hypothetical protein
MIVKKYNKSVITNTYVMKPLIVNKWIA